MLPEGVNPSPPIRLSSATNVPNKRNRDTVERQLEGIGERCRKGLLASGREGGYPADKSERISP
jgi:hypothetical protein